MGGGRGRGGSREPSSHASGLDTICLPVALYREVAGAIVPATGCQYTVFVHVVLYASADLAGTFVPSSTDLAGMFVPGWGGRGYGQSVWSVPRTARQ
eukprot:3622250-Rhodomonas_salina.4